MASFLRLGLDSEEVYAWCATGTPKLRVHPMVEPSSPSALQDKQTMIRESAACVLLLPA